MANVTLTQDQGIGNGSEYRSSAFGVVFPDYDESTRDSQAWVYVSISPK